MRRRDRYKFTNKKYSPIGIVAVNLGVISLTFLILAVILSCQTGGIAAFQYGITTAIGMLFSVVGLILAIVARTEKDQYYLFANIGIGINSFYIVLVIALIIWGMNIGQ